MNDEKDLIIKQQELLGYEYEADESIENLENKKYDSYRKDIIVRNDKYSISETYDSIKRAYIDLSPEFQRNEVWKDITKKSKFIESLMLNIPIPIFYCYDTAIEWQVIDGKQRLSTIRDYIEGKFALKGLQYLKEFENLTYSQLPELVRFQFDRYQLNFYILDYRTSKRVVYDIFYRINTGGAPLTSQEIRNVFATPKVRSLLKDMISCKSFVENTIGLKDIRMDAQELALRFIALKKCQQNNSEIVIKESNLTELLNETINLLNKEETSEFEQYKEMFKTGCMNARKLLGNNPFGRLISKNGSITHYNMVNKSLFAVYTVLLSDDKYQGIDLKDFSRVVIQELFSIMQLPNIMECLSSGTSSKIKIMTLFSSVNEVFKDNIKTNKEN